MIEHDGSNLTSEQDELLRKIIPYEYWYTPYIESDHHVDFENSPPEAEEVLSYQRFADCFLLSEEQSLWDLISSAFGVFLSDEEKQQFNNLYGG